MKYLGLIVLLLTGCAYIHSHEIPREVFQRPNGMQDVGEYRFYGGDYEHYNGCNTSHCNSKGLCWTSDLHCTPEPHFLLPVVEPDEDEDTSGD